jgi:hypothetical protein
MSYPSSTITRNYIFINKYKMKPFLILLVLVAALQPVLGQSEKNEPSAYLFPEFSSGKILLKAGTSSVRMMNYNLLTEEMIFEYQGKYLAVANLESIDTVYIKTRRFISVGKIFYEVPVNLKAPLIIQHACRVIAPGTASGYGGTSEASSTKEIGRLYGAGQSYEMKLPSDYKVIPTQQFFILKEGLPVRISNVKQLIKCFPDKEGEIRKFVKEHKTDFDKQENLVDLVTFCNNNS